MVSEPWLDPRKRRENFLRAAEFKNPWWIPCRVGFSMATWSKYRERLENIVLSHSKIFPGFKRGSVKFDDFGVRRKGNVFVDEWGCVWHFCIDGMQGQVVKHPLEDWDMLEKLRVPDPDAGLPREGRQMVSWDLIEEEVRRAKERGDLVAVGLPHGFFFQRLYYLRGFANLLKDFVREDSRIWKLIDILTEYNVELVKRILKLDVDLVGFGDDLGTQDRMPISPTMFRKYIYPSYKRIFGLVREKGVHVRLHTDGHVMEVVDQLIEAGVTILNIQDRVNGLENIGAKCKGRVCIDLDIDRQYLLPFSRPEDIREHIRRVILSLGSRKGGLMLVADVYPDVPLENIQSLCSALEEFIQLHLSLNS
ncbi:MAG: hypothetical protein DRJ51_02205 [Thermoprotei archaeon]|nr:MAG: hypothetical protein DRJ51_02205 [Thermoprotei archaeon]RLF03445.1 MAG: hypothetical protein DRJ59_00695 [Thermoprotei archaeon]